MSHKTFEDETFTLQSIELELNSLTESDPYVDHVRVLPAEGNVEKIKYSANKEVQKSGEITDPVSGVKFNASSTEQEDQRVSDLPEILTRAKALLDDGRTVKLHTNIGRYQDENTTSFYITDSHLENAEVLTEDESDKGEKGNERTESEVSQSSEDTDAEKQDSSPDSGEEDEEKTVF